MNPFVSLFRLGASIAVLPMLFLTACSGSAGLTATPAVTPECETSGTGFAVQIFGDAQHEQPRCRFALGSSTAAYVEISNVAASDHYVMIVQSESNAACVYMSPKGRTGNAKSLCDPTIRNVIGVQAPGGNVSFVWDFAQSLKTGLYLVSVFDQDADGGAGAVLGVGSVTLTSRDS